MSKTLRLIIGFPLIRQIAVRVALLMLALVGIFSLGMRLAFATDQPAAGATSIDVVPLLTIFGPLLLSAAGAVALALLHRMSTAATNMHLLQSDKLANDAIDAAVGHAELWAQEAMARIETGSITIDTHSRIAAQAAELVKDLAPKAIATAGLDGTAVQTRIRMALGDPTLVTAAAPAAASTLAAAPASGAGTAAVVGLALLVAFSPLLGGCGQTPAQIVNGEAAAVNGLVCGGQIALQVSTEASSNDSDLVKGITSATAAGTTLATSAPCVKAATEILDAMPVGGAPAAAP